MPVVLFLAAIILITSGARGTTKELLGQLADDAGAFSTWFVLIVVVMLVSKYRPLKPVADSFIVLIIVAFVLKQGTQVVYGVQEAMGTIGHKSAYWKS